MYPKEIELHPTEHAQLLKIIPYLRQFYDWEITQCPDAIPILRPNSIFGEEADETAWYAFVDLLFPCSTRSILPFRYLFHGTYWRFGLDDPEKRAIYTLLDFLGIEKRRRKSVFSYLTEKQFDVQECPEPPPTQYIRGNERGFSKCAQKKQCARRRKSADKYMYPNLGITSEEERIVPIHYWTLFQGNPRKHKQRRRRTLNTTTAASVLEPAIAAAKIAITVPIID